MKKGFAVFAVVLFLLSTQVTHAANLEEGWYVKIGWVTVGGWDGTSDRIIDWDFTSDLGIVGPFNVTSPDPLWARRMVSVDSTVSGIAPGTNIDLWGAPVAEVTFPITEVVICYDTNYDATQMRLELLIYSPDAGFTLLWSESKSGTHSVWTNVLGQSQYIPIGYVPVFRVTAVPEPPVAVVFVTGLSSLLVRIRRRIR